MTVGAFNSGAIANVVPDRAALKLNVRSFETDTRELILGRIEQLTRNMAEAYAIEATLAFERGTPAVSTIQQ